MCSAPARWHALWEHLGMRVKPADPATLTLPRRSNAEPLSCPPRHKSRCPRFHGPRLPQWAIEPWSQDLKHGHIWELCFIYSIIFQLVFHIYYMFVIYIYIYTCILYIPMGTVGKSNSNFSDVAVSEHWILQNPAYHRVKFPAKLAMWKIKAMRCRPQPAPA